MAYADFQNVPLTLPKTIAARRDLSLTDKIIYARLLVMGADKPHEVETSFITAELGISVKIWRAALEALSKNGLISFRCTRSQEKFKKVFLIEILQSEHADPAPENQDSKLTKSDVQSLQNVNNDKMSKLTKGNVQSLQNVTFKNDLLSLSSLSNKESNKELNKEGDKPLAKYPASVDEVHQLMAAWVDEHVKTTAGQWAAYLDLDLQAEGFFSYWNDRKWMRGKKPMKSIQGSIARWLGNDRLNCERLKRMAYVKPQNTTEFKRDQINRLFGKKNKSANDPFLIEVKQETL